MEPDQVENVETNTPNTPIIFEAPPPIVFTIQWGQIDNLINFLLQRKSVEFDYQNQVYIIDGVKFTPLFFNEVISKTSHLINVLSNVQTGNAATFKQPILQIKE